jgi:tRNA threonylcarbamoyladenosine biosynthesis protein TsaE
MSSPNHTYALADEPATLALGAAVARILKPGLTLYLRGDLGAGKTTLTRGLLRALGYTGPVKSPTYALVELYVFSGYILYHFDFYRFNQPEEWLEAGLDEHFNPGAVCLVEWPEKAGDLLPPADLEIVIEVVDAVEVDAAEQEDGQLAEPSRRITLNAHSERGTSCLSDLRFPPPPPAP